MHFVKSGFHISIRSLFLFMAALLLGGCGGVVTEESSALPCPSSNSLGPSSGSGRLLFYKLACDPAKPVTLWAVDPDNLGAPVQVESEYTPGSLQIVTDAVWDLSGRRIAGREVRYLVYAKRDGRLYKVSARKSDPPTPVPFSNETGAVFVPAPDSPGGEEPLFCGGFALDDFGNVENSLYIYTLAGPDQKCSLADDNIQKIARIGMNTAESPISVPSDRSYLIDYISPLTPGTVPGSPVPAGLIPLVDLVDKGSGGVIGWLALNDRVTTVPPDIPFRVKNAEKGILETSPFEHGFSEGTPIQLSGGLPGGLQPNKTYFVHVTSSKSFKLYVNEKRKTDGKVGFLGGTVLDDAGHTHPTTDDCAGEADCSEKAAEGQKVNPKHRDVNMIERFSSSGGTGTFRRLTAFTDLYRCGKELADCQVLKRTEVVTICKVSGDYQVGSLDAHLGQNFVVEARDSFGNPVSGVKVTWSGGDKEEETCVLFICAGGDEDDLEPTESTTGADGRASARGILRKNEGDSERNTNTFGASADGIGSPLSFTAGTAQQEKLTPPSCKRREDFLISNVTPLRDARYGGLFNGKVVLRFDLLHKPDPKNENPFLANQVKTKADLYLYDIPGNVLSIGAEYTSKEAFPEGLPFASDFDAAYFADKGTIYRLPYSGGLISFGNAQSLISEGTQVSQLDLTANRVVYSLIEKSPNSAITTLRTIGKGGGLFPATLLGPTADSLLPIMTGGDNVYFQTLRVVHNPNGVVSTIFFSKEDGSSPKTTQNAAYAGRTENKIFGTAGCSNKTNQDLFTFPICAGGTLVSLDASDPFSNQIALGTVPDDVMALFFDGYGMAALGEGDAFQREVEDGIEMPGEGKGNDLFFIRGDRAGSLARVSDTPGVNETLP